MADTMAHRGPDDEGYYIAGHLGLGFRRLAIIDLSGGHQPMSDSESSVWLVFNGEIYNFPELKRELEGYTYFLDQPIPKSSSWAISNGAWMS
jgi:asparagine synthase (glutamine-hydrolysing)